jgi:adenine phosphoribosyltransferase
MYYCNLITHPFLKTTMYNTDKEILAFIESLIRNVPDFPKPGILFKDITPLLSNAEGLRQTARLLTKPYTTEEVDVIVGMESRGFLFGTTMAMELNAGFVPVRKPNKLPFHKYSAAYELEYGTDSVEIHSDAIREGDKVLIHDDLIATGGTAAAATKLVHQMGGIVVGYSFIIELTFLNGREKLQHTAPVISLLQY